MWLAVAILFYFYVVSMLNTKKKDSRFFLKRDIYFLILSFMLKNLQIFMKIKSKFIDCVYFVQTAHLYSSIIITLVNYFFCIVKQLLSTWFSSLRSVCKKSLTLTWIFIILSLLSNIKIPFEKRSYCFDLTHGKQCNLAFQILKLLLSSLTLTSLDTVS